MKYTFPFLIALLYTFSVRAQNYIPFPVSGAMWTERHGNGEAAPSYQAYSLMGGDTVLGTNSYHKLYISDDPSFATWTFYGGIREDGSKRVYFMGLPASAERLLYDFSVIPGDVVNSVPGPAGTVSSIDSVYIGGQYRRRINFSTMTGAAWPYGAWIEGIGNSALGGLLYSATAQPTCDCGNKLICFSQEGTWLYHNPAYAGFDCMGNSLDVAGQLAGEQVSFFPNPATGISRLYIGAIHSFTKCIIYDIHGAAVLSYDIAGHEYVSINARQLSGGMYFYRLSGCEELPVTGKFIVQ